jgi:hypothetical protein
VARVTAGAALLPEPASRLLARKELVG